MGVNNWLEMAKADADKRGLAPVVPLLDGLAASLQALRDAADGLDSDDPEPVAARGGGRRTGAAGSRTATATSGTSSTASHRGGEPGLGQHRRPRRADVARHAEVRAPGRRLPGADHRTAARAERLHHHHRGRGAGRGPRRRSRRRRRPAHRSAARHSTLAQGSDRPGGRADDRRLARAEVASRRRPMHRSRPCCAKAGAVFVGKTNLHEFAFGTTSDDSGFGAAKNPVDPTRSPGGSSGGSAISVATGMAIATVGTDTGGSIRIPSAACGIVGLKPEWGEISAAGVVPLSRQLDHVGPMTRSVADAWLMYDVMRGARELSRPAAAAVSGLRVGVPRGFLFDRIDEEVEQVVLQAIDSLRLGGRAGVGRVHRARRGHAARLPAAGAVGRRGVSRAHAGDAAGRLHAERAVPPGDGPLRDGRRLRPRASPAGAARAGGGCGAGGGGRARAAVAGAFRRRRSARRPSASRAAPTPCAP